MVTDLNSAAHACTLLCRGQRHLHPLPGLDDAGLVCRCGASAWWVCYGGVLPAALTCHACLQGYPLEQLLRRSRRRQGGE